jgi:hypothetical protein
VSDYYEGIVAEYLRASRKCFINPQYLIQLEPGDMPKKGTSWYCDLLAVDFAAKRVLLCEVSFSRTLEHRAIN